MFFKKTYGFEGGSQNGKKSAAIFIFCVIGIDRQQLCTGGGLGLIVLDLLDVHSLEVSSMSAEKHQIGRKSEGKAEIFGWLVGSRPWLIG